MKIEKIGKRNIVFKFPVEEWTLNIHLIMGTQYNYIIDTGLGSLSAEPVKEYIENSDKPAIIVNTHYHWDHIWGNGSFSKNTIISHALCSKLIVEKWDNMTDEKGHFMKGDVQMCLPKLVFYDRLCFPQDNISIFYTPGHTQDSISVLDEKEGILNVGDNIGDSPEDIVPSIEAAQQIYIDTLLRYKTMNIDTLVSGHNSICGKNVLDLILKELAQ